MKELSLPKIALMVTVFVTGLNFYITPSQAETRFTNGCIPVRNYNYFQDGNGGGKSKTSCNDWSNLKDICFKKNGFGRCVSNWNDSISSVSGGTLTLYSETNYQGSCITVVSNGRVVNLDKYGFDNVASSIKSGEDGRCRVIK